MKDTERYHVSNIIPTFFGIKHSNMSGNALNNYLFKLNSEFSLVLILERLNESLILLKRLLHWSVYDIIYAPKKVKYNNDIHVNESQITRLKFTNKLEYVIYNFFYKKLEKEIEEAKDNFELEVAQFQDILDRTYVFCNTQSLFSKIFNFPASRWDESFTISRKDCNLIHQNYVYAFKKLYKERM